MIIIKLMGGLGNQMFQYAYGRHLSIKNNTDLKLDLNFLLDRTPKKLYVYRDFDLSIFKLKVNEANREDINLFNLSPESRLQRYSRLNKQRNISTYDPNGYYVLSEPSFPYCPYCLKFPKNSYIDGYWQSEKYFDDVRGIINEDFQFKNALSDLSLELKEKINSQNSVCINVRRGYINNLKERYYHGFLGLDYIYRGIEIIKSKVDNPHFFVFSDDVEWCEQNIKIDTPINFVKHEYAGEKFSEYLQLMIECKHFIIPNSSFGWWAIG